MDEPIKVAFRDAKEVIRKVFPGATSRRPVQIRTASTYQVANYWDGGSKNESGVIDLCTGRSISTEEIPKEFLQKAGNPLGLPICTVTLSSRYCVIEHCIFQGKDLGYRVYVHPDLASRLPDSVSVLGLGDASASP